MKPNDSKQIKCDLKRNTMENYNMVMMKINNLVISQISALNNPWRVEQINQSSVDSVLWHINPCMLFNAKFNANYI